MKALITTVSAIAAVLLAASASAHPLPHKPRLGPHARVAFLKDAVAHDRYVCRHGRHETRRWHCSALVWASRELREAEADVVEFENRVPEWPWQAIARCEQRGSGVHGVNWTAYSETYEGGYGFRHETWRDYRLPWMPASASDASPRVQTMVAIRVRDLAGGGGYSPWPACHRRLGLPG